MDAHEAGAERRHALERQLSRAVAERLHAEGGLATASLAGAVTLAAAACLTGLDLARVRALPDRLAGGRGVAVPAGQFVTFGDAPLEQLLRLAGAVPVPVGTVDAGGRHELEAALGPDMVAGLWVVGETTKPRDGPDLAGFVYTCRRAGKRTVVVDPASGRWTAWLDAGADLVVLDARAGLGGPEGGVLAGRLEAVRACVLNGLGIGAALRASETTLEATIRTLAAWQTPAEPAEPRKAATPAARDRAVEHARRFPEAEPPPQR